MQLNNDDALLSRVSSLSSAMRSTVRIAYESHNQYIDAFRSKSMPVFNVEMQDLHAKTKERISSPRGLIQIPSICQAFYVILKPETRKKVCKQILLYSKEYSVLISEDAKQIEVMPENAQYFIDQKRFYIYIDNEQRKFLIEAKRELLDLVLKNQYQTTLEPFFLSYLANGKIPPNTNLSAGYFSKIIFTKSFLIYYSIIPNRYLYPEIMNSWCVASVANFDYIFTRVHRYFFSQQEKIQTEIDVKCFIFKVLEIYLKADDSFKTFIQTFDTIPELTIENFTEKLASIQVNCHTHMALFIVFHEFSIKYNEEFAYKVICRILFHMGFKPYFTSKNKSGIEKLGEMIDFPEKLEAEQKIQLFDAVNELCQQPQNYCPKRTTIIVYQAYSNLLENIISNNIDFLSIIRTMSKEILN